MRCGWSWVTGERTVPSAQHPTDGIGDDSAVGPLDLVARDVMARLPYKQHLAGAATDGVEVGT